VAASAAASLMLNWLLREVTEALLEIQYIVLAKMVKQTAKKHRMMSNA
jgi:hypothetical protein